MLANRSLTPLQVFAVDTVVGDEIFQQRSDLTPITNAVLGHSCCEDSFSFVSILSAGGFSDLFATNRLRHPQRGTSRTEIETHLRMLSQFLSRFVCKLLFYYNLQRGFESRASTTSATPAPGVMGRF